MKERLFPGQDVVLRSDRIDARHLEALREAERNLVAKAVDKRKREFATGRHLARLALAELGVRDFELLNHADRAPIWPEHIHGSISHCDTRALVAVTPARQGSVGVDIEHRSELKEELWKTVFLPAEIARLHALAPERRGPFALVLFSAKEALYKAQYPWTRTFMGFHELEVRLEPAEGQEGRLLCIFQNEVGDLFARHEEAYGHFSLSAFDTGEVVTAVHIPAARRTRHLKPESR